MNEDERITELAVFVDDRVHSNFADGSSLIIHPSHSTRFSIDCITYFNNKGVQSRYVVEKVPKVDSVARKFLFTSMVGNNNEAL